MKREMDYAGLVKQAMEEIDFKMEVETGEDEAAFHIPMCAKNTNVIDLYMLVKKDGTVKMITYLLQDVEVFKRKVLKSVLNDLNREFRFVKFSMDENGDIHADYDYIFYDTEEEILKKHALAMLMIYTRIVDKAIPEIMKMLWIQDPDLTEPELHDSTKEVFYKQ